MTPSLAKDSGITAVVEAVDSSEAEPVNPLAAIEGAELHSRVYKTKVLPWLPWCRRLMSTLSDLDRKKQLGNFSAGCC